MKAELTQLFRPKAQNKIKQFLAEGIDMDSDEHLFVCYDERYEEEHQNPVPVTGKIAKERLSEEHYRIEYAGKNRETAMERRARRNREAVARSRAAIEEAKKELNRLKEGEHLEKIEKDDKITVKPTAKKKKTVVIE